MSVTKQSTSSIQIKINNLQVIYEDISNEVKIMQQLVTTEGFYNYWFEQLTTPCNKQKTYVQIFEEVNELYKKLFKVKEGRYKSYNSFQTISSRLRKLKK